MQQLQVVEHSNMRVLTTEQLADAYDSNRKVIMRNFQRNRDRYVLGIHYTPALNMFPFCIYGVRRVHGCMLSH